MGFHFDFYQKFVWLMFSTLPAYGYISVLFVVIMLKKTKSVEKNHLFLKKIAWNTFDFTGYKMIFQCYILFVTV